MYELQRNRAKSAIHVRITAKQSENCDTCTNYSETDRKVRYMYELQRNRAKRAIHVRITANQRNRAKSSKHVRITAKKSEKGDTCTNYSETDRKVRYMYELQRNRAKRAIHVRI